jgi:hypothetical protein
VKEIMSKKKYIRVGKEDNLNDRVFESEIKLKICENDEKYQRMLFKEELSKGLYELKD